MGKKLKIRLPNSDASAHGLERRVYNPIHCIIELAKLCQLANTVTKMYRSNKNIYFLSINHMNQPSQTQFIIFMVPLWMPRLYVPWKSCWKTKEPPNSLHYSKMRNHTGEMSRRTTRGTDTIPVPT